MEQHLRIGELSARHGLSTATVRYYERLGLLGEPERLDNGYRSFTSDDDDRLRFIVRAKALDLSLEEIRSLLDAWEQGRCQETRTNLRHLVAHKIREARNRAREAEAFATQLAHVYERLGREAPSTRECGCIPDLPSPATLALDEELSRIESSTCSCGSRLGAAAACDCGCCGSGGDAATPVHMTTITMGGGDDTMTNDTITITGDQTGTGATTCGCGCGPVATAAAPTREAATTSGCGCGCGTAPQTASVQEEVATSGCNCGSGDSTGCGPDCSCGSAG